MLRLPEAQRSESGNPVKAWSQAVAMPTYVPAKPDRNPMFLESRGYQGSSGQVYPLPYIDRIAESSVERPWAAIHLENEWIRVMVLPELGGRIHVGLDKTTGYDFFYCQNVIKPALVGLVGPWCSGGVEFNWPQHHRPATFMPVAVEIEREADGSVTVWCSDLDPMVRMKGMHGVRLRPGRASVELRVRLYNRTGDVQTFLWWANLATRVHDQYQSFFPPEVGHVFDHAKRAVSSFPQARGAYYGVDYRDRAAVAADGVPGDDLTWYRNIPVPTSYMIVGTDQDFFGGYDHRAGAGVVHVADHHIAPGKKQWTWDDHAFGHAWDRNLTDADGPYIELMAGVNTDNQPDFSWLMAGETRDFKQEWYPISAIEPAQHATRAGALALRLADGRAELGVCLPEAAHATVRLLARGAVVASLERKLGPGRPLVEQVAVPADCAAHDLRLEVQAGGRTLLAYQPARPGRRAAPAPASEPPALQAIAGADELYLTGLHLEPYRHATRSPLPYWQELLRRDPSDSRGNLALGRHHLRRAELDLAERHLRATVARLAAQGRRPEARAAWTAAATFRGDFRQRSVQPYSEMTLASALAWRRLGRELRARALLAGLAAHAATLRTAPARIDYFATSLPTMLLFSDDLQARQARHGLLLLAQAAHGRGRAALARKHLHALLREDPSNPAAHDLLAALDRPARIPA